MRRKNQALPPKEAEEILIRGSAGVLSLAGDGGYPYGVPLSYAYAQGRLYFHSAVSGHKLDAIRREPKASFCVVDQDQVASEEYTTYFRSAIAFGRVRVLETAAERQAAMELLAQKYCPEKTAEENRQTIADAWPRTCVLEFTVEHLTGKEAKELMANRNQRQ